jgi:putative peptidoglycan lipid II flippase
MFSKVLNGQSKSITGAALIIAGATLVSRLVGLVRDRIFAHYFGAGQVMDAYYAAFKIPDLIYSLLIIGALSAGFIPTFTKLFTAGDDKTPAWKLANNVLNITGVSMLILSILGIIFTPWIAPLIAPGFSLSEKALMITFTRIMFLSPVLLGLSMVVGGILQSLRSFVLYSIAPIFYNIGIILGVVALQPFIGISGIAWGVVLGAVLHFSLQAYSAYANGYRWRWSFNLKDKETRLVSKLMIPRTLGLAVSQFNLVIITILASLLPAGSVAIFNYANNLQAVPIGIIGIPFALAVFPVLSAAAAQNNREEFLKSLSATARQVLFLVLPLSIAIMLLRAQIVRVVLGSGAFDWAATVNTADALALFALGLFAQSLIPLLARAFYALSNTKTPFIIGIISELVGIIFSLILMKPLGVAGLALAFSIGGILNFTMLAIGMRKHFGSLGGDEALKSVFKITVAAIPMALAIQGLKYPLAVIFDQHYFWGILGQGLTAGIVGLAVYITMCYILKVPELMQIKNSLTRRWLHLRNLPTTESISNNE